MGASDPLDPDSPGSITILYQKWRQGQSAAVNELISRFRPRLLALARSTLAGRVQRASDAEDALQSAMISFWEKVEQGGFHEDLDRDDLWNVLGVITVRKALSMQEKERAQKRGGGKVVTGMPLDGISERACGSRLDIVCTELLEMLPLELRKFALMRLMGHKNREIADEFGCTVRKVERKLELVRAVWREEMESWRD